MMSAKLERRLAVLVVQVVLMTLGGCGQGGLPVGSERPVAEAESGRAPGFVDGAFEAIDAEIEAGGFPNTHALLVAHRGELLHESYFTGTDERWGEPLGDAPFGPEQLHDLRSVSKSVTSLLVGIALQEAGLDAVAAVATPVGDLLPEMVIPEPARAITLEHVLTMTLGVEWNEGDVPYTDPSNDEIRLYAARDPAQYVLSRPITTLPGSSWYYSGGSTQILASVVTHLSGERIDDFARTRVFEPLGVTEFEWLGPGNWTPDNPAAMSGLRLRARDLAKIGEMVLNEGRFGGAQIVPEQWIRMSTARHVEQVADWGVSGVFGYGYQWWIGTLASGTPVIAGVGNGNQRLFILPDEELVVTIFAGEYNRFEGHSNRLLTRLLELRAAPVEGSER